MTVRSLIGSGIILAILLVAGCGIDTSRPPNPQELINQGGMLYLENCSGCHQSDGQGWSDTYPNLAGNPIVTLHDAAPIVETVLFGQGSMPGFEGSLSSEEIAAILSFIRNEWGNSAPAISPRQVN